MKIKTQLKDVLAVQSHSYQETKMVEYIRRWVKSQKNIKLHEINHNLEGGKTITNMYLTKGTVGKGEYYPCYVAHTDTVHDFVDNLFISENRNKDGATTLYGWTYEYDEESGANLQVEAGCGGDDKVGVWACLNLLQNLDACKVALFAAEEVGTVGSSKADTKFFKDVGYVLQTDRKGNKDFVTKISGKYLSGKKFQKKISGLLKAHNFELQPNGGLTDVKALKGLDIDVCMANISSGYYRPHTDGEYVVVEDAENTLKLMYNIAKLLGNTLWSHKAPDYSVYTGSNYWPKSWAKVKTNKPKVDYASQWEKDVELDDWNRSFNALPKRNGACPTCDEDLRVINGTKVCVNPHCSSCDVQYSMDFWDDYGYNGGSFYDAEQIFPVTDKNLNLIGYYSIAKDKLYYKPIEVRTTDPNQTKIPF